MNEEEKEGTEQESPKTIGSEHVSGSEGIPDGASEGREDIPDLD